MKMRKEAASAWLCKGRAARRAGLERHVETHASLRQRHAPSRVAALVILQLTVASKDASRTPRLGTSSMAQARDAVAMATQSNPVRLLAKVTSSSPCKMVASASATTHTPQLTSRKASASPILAGIKTPTSRGHHHLCTSVVMMNAGLGARHRAT
jgi:hypothetical protein